MSDNEKYLDAKADFYQEFSEDKILPIERKIENVFDKYLDRWQQARIVGYLEIYEEITKDLEETLNFIRETK